MYKLFFSILVLGVLHSGIACSGETPTSAPARGTVFTLWPLIDYRESPSDGFANLSLLGPIFKLQKNKNETDMAVRPFFYSRTNHENRTVQHEYLYPIASSFSSDDQRSFQVLKLLSSDSFRRDMPEEEDSSSMLFPFYIAGKSPDHGSYWSLFPLYGDIYGHFYRDEYHYALFPLYGRTVNKGTTNYNILWPFFSVTRGENESGFRFWPLYGQSAKEGVYSRRFALWPFFSTSSTGLNTKNPKESLTLFPLYDSQISPDGETRHLFWPFFGHEINRKDKYEKWDYLWPLFWSASGEGRNALSILPFYQTDRKKDRHKEWYLWPLYRTEEFHSAEYSNQLDRVLFFLYSDQREVWHSDGLTRRRSYLWPLYTYRRDQQNISTFTFPAPVEPILPFEGIENNWAPLWRLYIQRWNSSGDSAVSFLWNLYWHESRGDSLAWELFPLMRYTAEQSSFDFLFFKGLVRYQSEAGKRALSFFWLPFAFEWGAETTSGGRQ